MCGHMWRQLRVLGLLLSLSPSACDDEPVGSAWPLEPLLHDGAYPTWSGWSLGNHRAEVPVPEASRPLAAVRTDLVWRRRSVPAAAETAVIAALPPTTAGGVPRLLRNVLLCNATSHSARVVFEPEGAAEVHLYYMPYNFTQPEGAFDASFTRWTPPNATSDPAFIAAHAGCPDALPPATLARFAARTEFDAFTDLERTASAAEAAALVRDAGSPPFLLFAEPRERPIRAAELPAAWLGRAASAGRPSLAATVSPGEFFVFQVRGATPTRALPMPLPGRPPSTVSSPRRGSLSAPSRSPCGPREAGCCASRSRARLAQNNCREASGKLHKTIKCPSPPAPLSGLRAREAEGA